MYYQLKGVIILFWILDVGSRRLEEIGGLIDGIYGHSHSLSHIFYLNGCSALIWV
jgi:hypothetical protein